MGEQRAETPFEVDAEIIGRGPNELSEVELPGETEAVSVDIPVESHVGFSVVAEPRVPFVDVHHVALSHVAAVHDLKPFAVSARHFGLERGAFVVLDNL